MKPRVIFIQGPPGSGKDALGKILANNNWFHEISKFATILKERTHVLFGANDENGDAATAEFFQDSKDTPNDIFFGMTPREAYITVSEKWMKPLAGQQVFGDLLLRELLTFDSPDFTHVITDSGFMPEALPLIEHFGAENCLIIQVQRPGHDFSRDSRGYWSTFGIDAFRVSNEGTLQGLEAWARGALPQLFTALPTTTPTKEPPHDGALCLPPRFGSDR